MKTRIITTTLLMLTLLAVAGCHDDLYVRTHSGWIKGLWADNVKGGVRTFLGIPYAQAPVGELRFVAPQPVQRWNGLLKAEALGPSCVQRAGALAAAGEQSEDCLSLNVYAPANIPKGGMPVMVFIHGGAFIAGGSSQYNGQRLAEAGNVIVVTLNYRLGALGFFKHPEIAGSGNAALADQQLALRWVKDNIKAFGGNPENITLLGESAGSASVCVHMVAPGSQQLVNRFILQSGTCIGGLQFLGESQADALGVQLGNDLCADVADTAGCLRELDSTALVNWGASNGLFGAGWAPTVIAGSDTLPAPALQLFASGQYSAGEVIIGTNRNEWGLFQSIGLAPAVQTVAQLSALIDAQFGPAAALVKAHYLPPVDALANPELVRLYSDTVFRCPSRALARVLSAQGTPVWLYSFDEGLAFHAMELPYVFGNPSPVLAPVLVEPLRATVQDYWTGFAASGNPNRDGQPEWPAYDAVSDQHMVLKEVSAAGANLAQSACDFWSALAGG
jgi:para-nitrobenzyl esterase